MKKLLSSFVLMSVILLSLLQIASADSRDDIARRISFSAGECFIVCDDGTIFMNKAAKIKFSEVEEWNDIVAISSCNSSVVGLKKDGTVIVTGKKSKELFAVEHWADIVQVIALDYGVYGLTSGGKIEYAGDATMKPMGIDRWKNVKTIVADWYLFAITNDGCVLSSVNDNFSTDKDFSKLNNVKSLIASESEVIVLNNDGSTLYYNMYNDNGFVETCSGNDIVQLAHIDGKLSGFALLKQDGKVIADTYSAYDGLEWNDIVIISGGAAVDKKGNIHFAREIEADEEIPTFDMKRYHFDEPSD